MDQVGLVFFLFSAVASCMVNPLDFAASVPGYSPSREHCVVLLGKHLYPTMRVFTQVYK